MESNNGGGRCQQVPGQEAHIFNHMQIAENSECEVHQVERKAPLRPLQESLSELCTLLHLLLLLPLETTTLLDFSLPINLE